MQWKQFLFTIIEAFPFFEQPTIRRSDVQEAPWLFASAKSSINDLLVYQTSGTTGPAMDVLFDPVSQACWLPQLESVLDLYNIKLSSDPGKVAIALICSQSSTLTYASLSSYLNGAGVLKINLNPNDWKDASHRIAFLEKFNPEVLTGDPFAFLSLMKLNPNIRPKAMVSSAMKLTDAVRRKLEEHFKCLVIDIYSLTECRMIAFAEGDKYRAIRHDLYLEVFDEEKDILLPYGQRGELVVTGGNNPFLPLIRYRTGDFCSIEIENNIPYLVDLEARKAVAFYTSEGKFVNNVEIARALSDYPLGGYKLHQNKDKSLLFTAWCNEQVGDKIEGVLKTIFGSEVALQISILKMENAPKGKIVTYTSEFSL